ncbi:AraC family transcriptional regulator [Anseongella ginsenosidimutans]|uniref:AraC family transcriptional regulator n=1 Tax=Anseongella ginsenosidimutans TaxID=496056 RepID=A0A4V2UTU2_9SPHI|nr:AraC family transcriptional regulator [Anseongella ginsenosidimutans]QEC53063.1 helix-turn-helix domain-containing protein [Anseongella ginsenosidimutans]TCS87678.1 AraC family transcriptional regulator [Anseongella ginsenosidimutans]
MKPQLVNLDYVLLDSFKIKEITAPYFTNSHHFHNDYELVLVLESTGKRVIGDRVENFKGGDMVFVGPNLPHAWFNDNEYYKQKEGLLARSIVTYFKKEWLENCVLALPGAEKLKKLLVNAVRGIKLEGKARERIASILINTGQSNGLKKSIDIFTVLYELSEAREYEMLTGISYVNSYNENEARRINEVYEYVLKNFTTQIKLEEVAAIANMSPNAFCRYFKTHTQKNFSYFINEVRIGHACKLLLKKDLSVSRVCFESGFQSMTNFNKFFKRFTGKSPNEYRKGIVSLE